MNSRWAMLAVIFVARTTMGFQFQAIPSVSEFLVEDLGFNYSQVGLLTGLFMLPGILLALPGGMLGQRFGSRPVALASLALMVVGGLVTAESGGFWLAAVGRTVSGAGGILLNIVLAKMVADWFAGRELSTAMAVMLTSWPVGVGLAVALLGEVARLLSWRTTVHVTALAAAGALVMLALLYRNPPPPAAATAPAPTPRFRLPLQEVKLCASTGLAWGLFNASLIVFVSFAPAFLVTRATSIAEAGVLVSLTIWTSIVSVPLGGWVADRTKNQDGLIVAGCLVTGVLLLFVPVFPGTGFWCVLIGFILGFPPGALMSLLPRALRAEVLATGFGYFYTVFYLGMAVAQPVAGAIRDLSKDPSTPIFFAGFVMAATVHALGMFRHIEGELASARRARTAASRTTPGGAGTRIPGEEER